MECCWSYVIRKKKPIKKSKGPDNISYFKLKNFYSCCSNVVGRGLTSGGNSLLEKSAKYEEGKGSTVVLQRPNPLMPGRTLDADVLPKMVKRIE